MIPCSFQEKPPNAPNPTARKLIVESGSPHRILSAIPSELARRRLYPTASDESAVAASAIIESVAAPKSTSEMQSGGISEEKLVRTDSLGLFFRQVRRPHHLYQLPDLLFIK